MRIRFLPILFCLFVFISPSLAQEVKAELFEQIVGELPCGDYLSRIENIVTFAQKNPSAKFYIFVYEGKIQTYKYKKDGSEIVEMSFPQYGLAKARLRSIKKYLSNDKRADVKRFVFVEAGLRDEFTVQFWKVPTSASAPLPAPTLKKTRYRKGKPEGFCLGCCES